MQGRRSRDDIAQAYTKRSGRPEHEAREFLQELTDLGVVVSGGYVVPTGGFPRAAPGECYYIQIDDQEPVSGSDEA